MFVLEKILSLVAKSASITTSITFCQYVGTTIYGYSVLADFENGKWYRLYLPENRVPMSSWLNVVVLSVLSGIMNNLVLLYQVSVPLHIILRSSGTVWSMLVGYLFAGRSYSKQQVVACVLMTVGVAVAALVAHDRASILHGEGIELTIGITLMIVSSIIGAFSGLYCENLFKTYGKYWQESLFYTHFLGLPAFLFLKSSIRLGISEIWSNPAVIVTRFFTIRPAFCYLILNVLTQCICIKGVNILASKTSALTVTIILLLRKVVSLLLSIVYFQRKFTGTEALGFSMVLTGVWLYATDSKGYRIRKAKPH